MYIVTKEIEGFSKEIQKLFQNGHSSLHPYQHPDFISINQQTNTNFIDNSWVIKLNEKKEIVFLGYSFIDKVQNCIEYPHGPFAEDNLEMEDGIRYIKELYGNFYDIKIGPYYKYSDKWNNFFKKEGFKESNRKWHRNTVIMSTKKMKELRNYNSKNRNVIRVAKKEGNYVVKSTNIKEAYHFCNIHNNLAEEKGFSKINCEYLKNIIESMSDVITLYLMKDRKGEIISGAVIVSAGKLAFYQKGASLKTKSANTQLLHYDICNRLFDKGIELYDLGGVDFSCEENKGVNKFKINLNNKEYIDVLPQYILKKEVK